MFLDYVAQCITVAQQTENKAIKSNATPCHNNKLFLAISSSSSASSWQVYGRATLERAHQGHVPCNIIMLKHHHKYPFAAKTQIQHLFGLLLMLLATHELCSIRFKQKILKLPK